MRMTVWVLCYWYSDGVERFCGVYGSQGEAEKAALEEFKVLPTDLFGDGELLRGRGEAGTVLGPVEIVIQPWDITA